MVDRVENWDTRLVDFAKSVVGHDFEWGETDCAILVRRGLIAIYGFDPWKGHVGTWTTRRGALRVAGRTEPQDALGASGATEVGTRYAWSGDVALGDSVDAHGMFQFGLLLPTRKVMTSSPEQGVIITDTLGLRPGTRFWRYGG